MQKKYVSLVVVTVFVAFAIGIYGGQVLANPDVSIRIAQGDILIESGNLLMNNNNITGANFFNFTTGFIQTNLTVSGRLKSTSPVKIEDGLAFFNKNSSGDKFHLYISGVDSLLNHTGLPDAFNQTFVFSTHHIENIYNMEVVFWDSENARPVLTLNEGAVQRASVFERSLIIGREKGLQALDENYTKGLAFSNVDFDTSLTGADLGVEDDIEARGSIFAQENVTATYFMGDGSQLTNCGVDLNLAIGSGWLAGGSIVKNSGTSTFNLTTDAHFIIVNQSNALNVTYNIYTYPATDNIDIGTVINEDRWIALSAYPNGTVKMNFLHPDLTAQERRDYAILGRFWTDESGYILGMAKYSAPGYGYGKTLEDLLSVLGNAFNIDGNILSANGANMRLDKTAGKSFRYGAWSEEQPASPHIGTDYAVANISEYYYVTQNGTSYSVTDQIQIQWDNGGTLEAMPSNKFQVQMLWHWGYDQAIAVQYGQKIYENLDDARAGYASDPIIINKALLRGAKLRGWLIMKTGTTELNDTTYAEFITAPDVWFGSGGGGGIGGSTTFLGLIDTPSSFTSGSVLFTSDSAVTEDNSNLYWDDINNRLGIVTTNPSAALDVANTDIDIASEIRLKRIDTSIEDTNALGAVYFTGTDGGSEVAPQIGAGIIAWAAEPWATGDFGTDLDFYTADIGSSTFTSKMRIESTGNVGIGTSTPGGDGFPKDFTAGGTLLEIGDGTKDCGITLRSRTSAGNAFDIWQDYSQINLYIDSRRDDDTTKITIRTKTNGIPINALTIFGSGYIDIPGVYAETTGSSANVFVASDGSLRRSTSSRRFKENINYDGVNASVVYDLKPVSFTSIFPDDGRKEFFGFIAEDVFDVEPRLVTLDNEGIPDGLHYGQFTALNTKAIQEQQVEIEQLQAEIDSLEARIAELERLILEHPND